MNRITLDGIIFGLQRFGGISNFWMRLIDATEGDLPGRVDVLLPRSIRTADMSVMKGASVRTERLSPKLSRYMPASVVDARSVFHTSYYRRPSRSVDRYVTSVYDFTYERYFAGLPRVVHHHQKRASILAADLSICISEATRADLLSNFPGVDPARTCVVPLGVDRAHFYPDDRPASGRPYVLFVGQRSGYKRFDLAVDAVALSAGLEFAIVGPPLTDEEKLRLERVLPGRWVEYGGIARDMLRRLYSGAFAFVFPSDYEGFGLPILEAMACGCPVVAADRSSFPEVAGEAALLAPAQTAEAYAALFSQLEDDECRTRLIAAGIERVALFDWTRTFARLWACYN